jgi:transposase
MKTYSIAFRQKIRDVYHNEPLSQRAIANRFCGASELRTKIGLHSIVRPKILLLKLSDAESN